LPLCTSSDTCPLNTPVMQGERERGREGERERGREGERERGREESSGEEGGREGGKEEDCVCIIFFFIINT